VCEPCYRATLSRRGTCEACGAERCLVSPPGPVARLCAGCPGAPQLATCRGCGTEERPYLDGRCVRCALAARAAELVGAPDGPLGAVCQHRRCPPALQRPQLATAFSRRKLLGKVASGQVALAHEALDAHPARRGADYLRHLLVANGVLPARDDALVRLEAWVGRRLASVEDKPGCSDSGGARPSSDDDRSEDPPVRPARVEQGPDPVVLEVPEPEADPLDALHQVVERLGGAVRVNRRMHLNTVT